MRWSLASVTLVLAAPLQAGTYSAAEPSPFLVGPGGQLQELPYVPTFKTFLDERLNAANPATPEALDGQPTFRGLAAARVRTNEIRSIQPRERDEIAWAIDLIRLGRAAEAVNKLEPRARDRTPDYVALVTLAHAHAARGEWEEAVRAHGLAVLDAEPPATLPGVAPGLTRRYFEIEKQLYTRWLRLKLRESGQREGLAEQDVLPLFGEPPVRWAGESGRYEPGNLAASERAKLPPDALAVVQQLLLWAPDDTRLLWLLAELYAAGGQLREAEQVFDQCTWGRSVTNRRILMEHRSAVRDAVAALPPEKLEELPADAPAVLDDPDARDAAQWARLQPRVMLAGGVFAVVVVVLGGLAIRATRRR